MQCRSISTEVGRQLAAYLFESIIDLIQRLFKLVYVDIVGDKLSLILSIFGGVKYFSKVEPLEKEFIQGIIETANSASK
jgi:hypothetical protein